MYQDIEQLFTEANDKNNSSVNLSNQVNKTKESYKPNIDNFLGNQNIVEQQMNSFSNEKSISNSEKSEQKSEISDLNNMFDNLSAEINEIKRGAIS